jgi:hypothetical protein
MPVAQEPVLIIEQAAVILVVLVAFAVLAVTCLLLPEARRRLFETAARIGAARLSRLRRAARVADLGRYAEEVAVAAARAAATAERRHADWAEAQRNCEAAWQAFEVADAAARTAEHAALYSVPDLDVDPDELSAARRRLRDVAMEAYRRGELSAEQLTDLLAYRNGWERGMSACEQEAMLRRIVRQRLLAAYRTASELERTARHAADMAAGAKRSLEDEAFAAAERARQAPTGRIRRGTSVRPAIPGQRTGLQELSSLMADAPERREMATAGSRSDVS